jgi:LysM repeat protein
MEALKPLLVLGLLGTILYGAFSILQKGPGNSGPAWQPPAASSHADLASDAPPFAPTAPAVEIPAPAVHQPAAPVTASAPPISELPAAQAAAFPPPSSAATAPPVTADPALPPASPVPPTFLTAQSAPPPVADTSAPSQAAPVEPPPTTSFPAPSMAASAPAAPAATAAATGSAAFAAAWSEAHDMLAGGRYAEALAALSVWHDDPSLSIEESQRLEDLLGQLAGTVIYSQQDLLLPPHVVAPGETLPAIASQLAVPWQLLAKINGVDDPSRLVPGEHLKMLRGPFDAVVSVSRRRLSLQVGGNYAGTFPVVIGRHVQDRVGASLAVVDVRRGDASSPSSPSAPSGPAAQVAFVSPAASTSIVLGDGLSIEASEDPSVVADSAPQASLIVSARDLEELIDILGPGSQVLIRQ